MRVNKSGEKTNSFQDLNERFHAREMLPQCRTLKQKEEKKSKKEKKTKKRKPKRKEETIAEQEEEDSTIKEGTIMSSALDRYSKEKEEDHWCGGVRHGYSRATDRAGR